MKILRLLLNKFVIYDKNKWVNKHIFENRLIYVLFITQVIEVPSMSLVSIFPLCFYPHIKHILPMENVTSKDYQVLFMRSLHLIASNE